MSDDAVARAATGTTPGAPGILGGTAAARRVAGATVVVVAGSGVALLGSLAARVLLARAVTPAELGSILLAIAVASAAGGLASLGLNTAAAQRVAAALGAGDPARARGTARAALRLALAVGLVTAGLTLGVGLLVAAIGGAGEAGRFGAALAAVSPLALGMALGLTMLGISRGFGTVMARATLRDAGGGVLRALAVGAVFAAAGGPLVYAAAFAAASLAAELSFVAWGLRQGFARGGASGDPELLRSLPPYALLEGLAQITQWLDILLLGALASAAAVGFYGVAHSLHRALWILLLAPAHAFLPAASSAAATGDLEGLREVHRRTRLLVLALLYLPLLVAIAVPDLPVRLLVGARYLPAAPLLRLLGLTLLVSVVFAYADHALLALGRSSATAALRTASLAAAVVVLLVLVPRIGASGAALAMLVAEALRCVGCVALLVREGGMRLRAVVPLPTAGAVAAGAAVLAAAPLLTTDWARAALVAGVGTAGSLALLALSLRTPQAPRAS